MDINTPDIDGGTIDGTVIGGATPAAISGTTGQFGTSLNVDGTGTMDGLTVDGDASISSSNVRLRLFETDTTDLNTQFQNSGGDFFLKTLADDASSSTTRLSIDHSTGDISFYEDTGSTPKLFWDASAESLGIGTASPSSKLTLDTGGNGTAGYFDINSSGGGRLKLGYSFTANPSAIQAAQIYATASGNLAISSRGNNASAIQFYTSGGTSPTEKMRITSTGNCGIGTTSPSTKLEVNASAVGGIVNFRKADTSVGTIGASDNASSDLTIFSTAASHIGLQFGNTRLQPTDNAGAPTNGVADLGGSTSKFKDLHLSGVMAAGNGSASAPSVRGTDTNTGLFFPSGGVTCFTSNGDERGRWAASGNLLVGGTADRGGRICVGGTSSTARILPQTDNVGYIGQAAFRWQALYAVNGTVQTSDEREKTEIKPTTLGLEFIKDLRPVSYKWIDGEQQDKGKDKREHQGLIAQQVAKAVEKHGIDKNAFGGLDIQKTDKYDDFHGMQYDQLIAPLIKAVQEQQDTIESLTARIAALEE